VLFPPGTYLVGDSGGGTAISITSVSNVALVGAGPGSTTLKLGDNENAHVIGLTNTTNVLIRDFTIDGNTASQTDLTHGIRASGALGLWIERCEIKDTGHYGIGVQDGTNKRLFFSKLYIHDTGGDGIDIKNKNDDNEQCVMSDIVVENHGSDATHTGQAGVDIRGTWQLSNIVVRYSVLDGDGIRFRDGELLDPSGLGGHRSALTGFYVQGGGGASTGLGVAIGARDVTVANGYVRATNVGVSAGDDRIRVSNVTAEACVGDGFIALVGAHDSVFSSCSALTCTDEGFAIRANRVKVTNCLADTNGGDGINIEATATDTQLAANTLQSNVGLSVRDSGTTTHASKNIGWVTEGNLQSSTLACDSTGSKVTTIAHGLAVTPAVKDVQLTLLQETSVSDPRFGLLRVDGVDATNITCRAVVTTASATGGATFRIGARVDAKP
jgi:hypothetical protein